MPATPEREQALRALGLSQERYVSAMLDLVNAGNRPPDQMYEQFLAAARRLLSDGAGYEGSWPGSFSLQAIAVPLVQQLSIYADFLQAEGARERARQCRDEADEITARYLGRVAAALVARDRAKDAAAAGRFHEALTRLDEVTETLTEAGEVLEAAQTALERANIYEWLGDFDRSLAVLRSVRAQASALPALVSPPSLVPLAITDLAAAIRDGKTIGKQDEEAAAAWRIGFEMTQAEGRLHRFAGNYDEAERDLEQALPAAESIGVSAGIEAHLAAIACARGDLDTADSLITRIAPDFERPLFRSRRPALRLLQADVLLARDRPADALACLGAGLRDLADAPDPDQAWKLHWRRGRALTSLGRPAQALTAYRAGGAAVDDLRKASLGYRLDNTFLRDKLPMFYAAIDLAVQQGNAPAAVWLIELIKARGLAATLSLPRAERGPAGDEARFDDVSARIDGIDFERYSGSAGTSALRRRTELLAEREALLERLRIHDPRWRAITQPAPVDIGSLTALLGSSGRAALSLFLRPGRIIAALLDGGGVAVGSRNLDSRAEQEVRAYARNLRRARDPYRYDFSGETGCTMADLVPPGIIARATAAPTLVIVPHGILHLLPWAAMMTEGSHRLFERCAVGMLPNLAALPVLDSTPAGDPRALLIGDPVYAGLADFGDLPQAGFEISDIAALYGTRLLAPPCTRDDATSSAFWNLTSRADAASAIVHLACHGILDADEPLSSGLLLSRSKVDAAEILLRRIATPEVILSACSSGWRPQATHGIELAGDDALGLTASFLEAGARFVLVSIPRADDEAIREFTVAWHRHRRAGASPLAAFRASQRDMHDAAPAEAWRWAGVAAYGCR